jgi:hypothetical protein
MLDRLVGFLVKLAFTFRTSINYTYMIYCIYDIGDYFSQRIRRMVFCRRSGSANIDSDGT